ncbi:MAG: thioester domain-containing protein, partial [Oscillospiraceae bacterium]
MPTLFEKILGGIIIKKKFTAMSAFIITLMLCLESVVFAAPPTTAYTFTGTGELGYNINIPNVGEKPMGTQLLTGSDGKQIVGYCIDYAVDLKPNHSYTVGNLEDFSLLTADTAGKIRKILLNSYPYISIA